MEERTATPVEESAAVDANGQKAAGFDVVLALVAAQVATISAKNVPATPAVAQQQPVPAHTQVDPALLASSDAEAALQSQLLGKETTEVVESSQWLAQSRSLLANFAQTANVSAPTAQVQPQGTAQAQPAQAQPAPQASAQAVAILGTQAVQTATQLPLEGVHTAAQTPRQSTDAPAVMEPAFTAVQGLQSAAESARPTAPDGTAQTLAQPLVKGAQVRVPTPAAAETAQAQQPAASAPKMSSTDPKVATKESSPRADAAHDERARPATEEASKQPFAGPVQLDARLMAAPPSAPQPPVAHKSAEPAAVVQAPAVAPQQAVAQPLQSDARPVQTETIPMETPPFVLPFEAAQDAVRLPLQAAPRAVSEASTPKIALKAAQDAQTNAPVAVSAVALPADVQLVQSLVQGDADAQQVSASQSEGKLNAQELAQANVRVELVNVEQPAELNAREQNAQLEQNVGDGRAELTFEREPRETAERGQSEQREPSSSEQQQQGSFQQQSRDPGFAPSEVQGARGLDAVVASLLRASGGDERAPTNPLASHAAFRQEPVRVVTAKSVEVKSNEAAANLQQQLVQSEVMRMRDEESRERGAEKLDAAPEFMMHARQELHQVRGPEVSEPVLPTQSAVYVPVDPDAAAMGNIARGEGVQAANISIDHPELGAMDLMVQTEKGRVDVRATLQTQRAATVLRAHESALRTGIQQAGMTFGALKVRSREGDGTTVKTRDSGKRRREA